MFESSRVEVFYNGKFPGKDEGGQGKEKKEGRVEGWKEGGQGRGMGRRRAV